MTTPDGFYQAEALDHGTWESNKKGMLLKIPVKLETGDTGEALAFLGEDEEKAEKTRAALISWGWDASRAWPVVGQTLRVSVSTKERNGKPEKSIFLVGKNVAKKVEGDDLSKFLANEKARMSGKSHDPFA